jgi:succinate-semialdehyde dehydrogenase/glutarate-semialdehyde dehydrogenase
MEFHNKLYIDGQWLDSSSGAEFSVFNPADETLITHVASATKKDAKLAINAAEIAMSKWSKKSPRERSEVLRKVFELMDQRLDYFAELITLENGKGYTDAIGEARYAAEFFRWFSEEAVRLEGSLSTAPVSKAKIMVHHKPAGIAVLITPWNYPAAMGTRKIAPALAAGCSVIIKPASETPLTMLALMPILEEAGVPKGLVNVLPTDNAAVLTEKLLLDPRVRVISFTGSTSVGKIILKVASEQVLKPAMELGGNAPLIVFDDADLEESVNGAMLAKMRNLGEACTAANRFYIQDNIYDAFVQKFTAKMKALKVGNGLDKSVDVGPLVNEKTISKVEMLVNDALSKGAKILLGGKRLKNKGYFFPPTVLTDIPDNAKCLKDEIFGPVATIQKFTNQDEVIKRANDTEYGLVAYVFTQDIKRGLQVSEQLEFGMVGLNRGIVSDPAAPFGGSKQSGLGREGGHEGILEFTESQYISLEW